MKINRHFSTLLFIACLIFTTTIFAQFGIPEVAKSDTKTIEAVQKDQDRLVKDYTAYTLELTDAQIYMADAFALTTESADLKKLKEKLSADKSMSKDDMEKQRVLNSKVQKTIDEKMSAETPLSDDGKTLFSKSLPPYINSVKNAKKTAEQAEKTLKKTQKALESASALDKAKITDASDMITFLAPKIPEDAAVMTSTGTKYVSFAEKHGIEVPANAVDAFK